MSVCSLPSWGIRNGTTNNDTRVECGYLQILGRIRVYLYLLVIGFLQLFDPQLGAAGHLQRLQMWSDHFAKFRHGTGDKSKNEPQHTLQRQRFFLSMNRSLEEATAWIATRRVSNKPHSTRRFWTRIRGHHLIGGLREVEHMRTRDVAACCRLPIRAASARTRMKSRDRRWSRRVNNAHSRLRNASNAPRTAKNHSLKKHPRFYRKTPRSLFFGPVLRTPLPQWTIGDVILVVIIFYSPAASRARSRRFDELSFLSRHRRQVYEQNSKLLADRLPRRLERRTQFWSKNARTRYRPRILKVGRGGAGEIIILEREQCVRLR